MITISLQEKNNNLIAIEPITPIVCGNSNYNFEIAFSESWNSITNKVAIVVVGNQKTAVSFTSNTFRLPALPNAFKLSLVIMSDETETEKLTTSVLELETEPTLTSTSIEEFEPISEYAQTVLGKITEFANGTAKVKFAEIADTAKNTSNPNLLINGDFRVNQRGSSSYSFSSVGGYIVDRWFSDSGQSWQINTDGSITQTNTSAQNNRWLCQWIEDYALLLGKTITISMKVKNAVAGKQYKLGVYDGTSVTAVAGTYNSSGEQTVTATVTIPETINGTKLGVIAYPRNEASASATATLCYIKAELGDTATAFSPRPYAEELLLCQRYYQVVQLMEFEHICFPRSTTTLRAHITYDTQMRTTPTITQLKTITIYQIDTFKTYKQADIGFNSLTTGLKNAELTLENYTELTIGKLYGVQYPSNTMFTLDAEVY